MQTTTDSTGLCNDHLSSASKSSQLFTTVLAQQHPGRRHHFHEFPLEVFQGILRAFNARPRGLAGDRL